MSAEERRAWVERRDAEKVRAADRERYYRDWEKRRAASDRYQRENPDVVRAGRERWLERNPEKRRAHIIVGNAIRDGKLVKGPCEFVDSGECRGRIHAHHDDYTKPMEVRWLCMAHHNRLHASANIVDSDQGAPRALIINQEG